LTAQAKGQEFEARQEQRDGHRCFTTSLVTGERFERVQVWEILLLSFLIERFCEPPELAISAFHNAG